MNIMQCQMCKKPFASAGGKICPACQEQIGKDFITVREYIYEHKHSNIDTISEETEVSKQVILHLLKEGRLILESEDGGGVLFCESCKKPINTGRLCKDCTKTLSSSIGGKATKTAANVSGKPEQNFKGVAKLRK